LVVKDELASELVGLPSPCVDAWLRIRVWHRCFKFAQRRIRFDRIARLNRVWRKTGVDLK
jgi:hypothetical protein